MILVRALRAAVGAAALSLVARPVFAGTAEAAPGANRPDWVIWAVLGAILLVLFFVLIGTQGGWRGKRGKPEPPYF